MTIQANFPAIKPSLMLDFANTKQLDSRITYTRASTASYYDGVTTAMAEQNLSINSEVFSSWNNVGITVTDNSTTAPDGNTTADTIAGTSGVSYRANNVSITTGLAYTFSIYAKANATNFLQIVGGSSGFDGTTWANFDLSSGVVGSKGASATSTITSVGNGWYRCTMTATSTATGSSNVFAITPCEASTSGRFASLVGATSIYVWGAQVEQRSAVTAYTATTTQAITNYIPVLQTAASGVARFDNNPTTGESLGLLIEESRTNLFTYSSQFDNAAWTKVATTITADAMVAPDGTLTADAFISSATTAAHYLNLVTPSLTSGTAYTSSFYAKAAGYNYVAVASISISRVANALFDLALGTVVSTTGTATITAVGNGWYRCTATLTSPSTGVDVLAIALANTNSGGYVPTFAGNGYSGVLLWGAQFEQGAFATSYIPTVASQVTRAADAASMTGTNFSSWFNADQGSIYADFDCIGVGVGNQRIYSIINSAGDGYYGVRLSNTIYNEAYQFGAQQASLQVSNSSINTAIKNIFAIQTNNFAASTNAASPLTDTSGLVAAATAMYIGTRAAFDNQLNGHIRKIAYYPIRVTNAQLQALTS